LRFYSYNDKGNSFLIVLIPDTFTFENFEFTPKGWFASDYVGSNNRFSSVVA